MPANPFMFVVLLMKIAFGGLVGWLVYSAFTSPMPLPYYFKNIFVRWRATLATMLGVALVVAVYVMLQAMAAGLGEAGGKTGDARHLMMGRQGSPAGSNSQGNREQFRP